jgi:hypothetical protein
MVAFYMDMLDRHAKVVINRSAELKYFSSASSATRSVRLAPNETISSWIVDKDAVWEEARLRKNKVKQLAARRKWKLLHSQFREFLRYHFGHLRHLQVRSHLL